MVIHVKANRVWFPFHSERMELVGEALVGWKPIRCANSVIAGIAGAVNGAVNQTWFFADIFHDVDLAAGGPAGFVDVVAEHPEGGPDALSARNLDAGLEAPVGLRKFAKCFQARRSVISRDAIRASVFLLQDF